MITSFLKGIILLYLTFFIPQSLSDSSKLSNIAVDSNAKQHLFFSSHDDKLSYSLGVSLGDYISESFQKQKDIGIILNKYRLLSGIQDSILNTLKLSNQEITSNLRELDEKIKIVEKNQIDSMVQQNSQEGKNYMEKISHLKGVKKTNTGLEYLIEKKGEGIQITDTTKITVHYKGYLVNGKEFDNSYVRNMPVSFFLKDVIPGWKEGLKYIRKGGKIKLVIPPSLAYGSENINNIPGNSTLIFDIELIDVVDEK